MISLLSWNLNKLGLWAEIEQSGADLALLQEVPHPSRCPLPEVLPGGTDTWVTAGWEKRPWRTAIARVSDRLRLEPIVSGDLGGDDPTALTISRSGTIAAAKLFVDESYKFTAVSVYAPWERYLGKESPIWADGSAHRILSDLSPLLWKQKQEPVIVTGDWNILRGYGEHGDEHAKHRYASVFARAEALGLSLAGPEFPNGRQADPWPDELPEGSSCVPTYRTNKQRPEDATRQLDFVFVSPSLKPRVKVRALNEPAEWGPSDHCRVAIDVDL